MLTSRTLRGLIEPAAQVSYSTNYCVQLASRKFEIGSVARPRGYQVGAIRRHLSTTSIRYKIFAPLDPDGPPPARKNFKENLLPPEWLKLVQKYPDFLPDPINNNPLLVHKQIGDMLQRRTVIEIPEFYVGSIVSVTCSDQYSTTKKSKFMGICIQRSGRLLNSTFTLRNVIDGMGLEIRYDLYNPLILNIEVLKLEKRLDDELIYLRDALPEYSTFPENMKPVTLEIGGDVPINKTLVKMKPQPWSRRWERYFFKGIEKLESVPELFVKRAMEIKNDNVNNYDTMLEYRRHCTEETLYNICKKLSVYEDTIVRQREETKARRILKVVKKSTLNASEKA